MASTAVVLTRGPDSLPSLHIQRRIERLQNRKQELEEWLASEMKRPRPDDATVRRIKREKVMVKDALRRVEASTTH